MNPRISRLATSVGNIGSRSHIAARSTSAVIGAAILIGWFGSASATDFGLDERPSNITCVAPDRPDTNLDITAERVYENLPLSDILPISMSQPPNDPSRWFIAGRDGEIFSFANDDAVASKQLVLDLADQLQFTSPTASEQYGLVAFAFHPSFPASPFIYVGYNAKPSANEPIHSVVSRFTSMDGGQTLDPMSEQIVLDVTLVPNRPWHHMGQLLFGTDGYLYIGLGDSQIPDDAQDLNDLKGSILRIDVDQGFPYAIPPDNPLVGTGFREEIFAWGFRNPWRFTIDRDTGELWLGDVGQALYEEVNQVDSGANHGWPIMEGNDCNGGPGCDATGLTPPVLVIEHPAARAVIGGYMYRGSEIPAMQGTYIFGDATYRQVRRLVYDLDGQADWDVIAQTPFKISNFSEALDGEIYFTHHEWPQLHKLVLTDPSGGSSNFPGLLSETGCVDPLDPVTAASGLIPYTLNAPLWSDGAEKNRWMALPDGQTIDILPDGDFEFPIGTVLMKMFSFDAIPVETRLFIRHDDGAWAGYSYEWNDDLSDAVLLPAGKVKEISPEITWTFPSRNECLQCHTNVASFSLGPEIIQLNRPFLYPSTQVEANQLDTLEHIGLLTNGLPDESSNLQALVSLSASGAPDERKAKSYLHSNCSGCHRPQGPAPTAADFRFTTPIELMNVCDALPSAGDLGVPGARLLSPGNPDNSIISIRMESLNNNRMPPLGTAIVDTDGTSAIDAWISHFDVCAVYADSDVDLVRDNVDNCIEVSNPSQHDADGDGHGNLCDADFDNDCLISFSDLSTMADGFLTADPLIDLNSDGVVNLADLNIMAELFFQQPGPSFTGSLCNP